MYKTIQVVRVFWFINSIFRIFGYLETIFLNSSIYQILSLVRFRFFNSKDIGSMRLFMKFSLVSVLVI